MKMTTELRTEITAAIKPCLEQLDALEQMDIGEKQKSLSDEIVKQINRDLDAFVAYTSGDDEGRCFVCIAYNTQGIFNPWKDAYVTLVKDRYADGNHQIVLSPDYKDYIYISDHFIDLEQD